MRAISRQAGRESLRGEHAWAGRLPLAVLGLFVVGVAVLLARTGVHNHSVFIDEANAVVFGRHIARDPSVAFTASLAKGPERMTSLILAAIAAVTADTGRQLWAWHAALALCQALVAVPVFAAARELGLGRWQALAPAAIAVTGPFATYGMFGLDTSVGVLSATTMLWAMLRALRRPGLVSDVWVLLSLAATALSREGWAPLVVALIPAAIAVMWLERPAGEGRSRDGLEPPPREPFGTWLRALPARALRRHPLLVPVLGAGVVVLAAAGPSSLLGGHAYGGIRLGAHIEARMLWNNSRLLLTHLALGVAVVPFMLALPLLVRDLVRAPSPTEGAFAWLVLGLLVVFSYAYYLSMNEDRYMAVLAPPFALAGALAVFRRPPPLWSVVLGAVLTARLVVTSYAWPGTGPFDFFVAPTARFFDRVVLGNLSVHLPISTHHVATVALVVVAFAAVLLALAALGLPRTRPRVGQAVGGAILAGLLAVQVAGAQYPGRKFVEAVGNPHFTAEQIGFIDAVAGRSVNASQPLALDGVVDPDLSSQLPLLRVYNQSLGLGLAVLRYPFQPGSPAPPEPWARIDGRTGRAVVRGGLPTVLVSKPGFSAVGLVGTPLPGSPAYPFAQLTRLAHPLRAAWEIRGDGGGIYPPPGRMLRLRVFGPAPRTCLHGGVSAHPLGDRPVRFALIGAPRARRGTAPPGVPQRFSLPLRAGVTQTLKLRAATARLPDGSRAGPTLLDLSLRRC